MDITNKRLAFIASFIDKSDIVADIGSDHGYIPAYLAAIGHSYVYASDNKKGPYERLKKALRNTSNIEVALADGIASLPARVNTLLISGMGGTLITRILNAHPQNLANINKLILSPHGNESELRQIVNKLGYQIVAEGIVFDDKYYEVIIAKRGKEVLSELEYTFGPINLKMKTEVFSAKWRCELDRINDLLQHKNLTITRQNELNTRMLTIKMALEEE